MSIEGRSPEEERLDNLEAEVCRITGLASLLEHTLEELEKLEARVARLEDGLEAVQKPDTSRLARFAYKSIPNAVQWHNAEIGNLRRRVERLEE